MVILMGKLKKRLTEWRSLSLTATVLRAMLRFRSSFYTGGIGVELGICRQAHKRHTLTRDLERDLAVFFPLMKCTNRIENKKYLLHTMCGHHMPYYLLRGQLHVARAAQALRGAAVELHFGARELLGGRQQARAQRDEPRVLRARAAKEPPTEAAVVAADQKVVEEFAALQAHRRLVVAHPMPERAEVFRAPKLIWSK